jgi:molybdenum cofactor biosynthesis enzyme MoaA
MRIQTFSIVAGSEACNARCPYCVSRMTPDYALEAREPEVNWRNFEIGCRFAKDSGVSTVLITGKGEPTLFPEQITRFLTRLEPFRFPFIELQTNGLALAASGRAQDALQDWYERGLTLVAVSVVHEDPARNAEIFTGGRRTAELAGLVQLLHGRGLAVRLSCTMLRGYVDALEPARRLIDFAREQGVEQLTLRPVELPAHSRDEEVAAWVRAHRLPAEVLHELRDWLDEHGTRLMELVHGAIVYDCAGQNVCLNNCLTIDPSDERIRQLIFFPDGHLRYDWQYAGAVLL